MLPLIHHPYIIIKLKQILFKRAIEMLQVDTACLEPDTKWHKVKETRSLSLLGYLILQLLATGELQQSLTKQE